MPVVETIRPGVQFIAPAAAAFRRADATVVARLGRHIDVNSTYRDPELQLRMHLASLAWMNGTGPYPGHSYAVHPRDSFHVAGTALDSDDWVNAYIVAVLADNGFIRNRLYVKNENHHFEWLRDRDNHYGKPVPAGSGAVPFNPGTGSAGGLTPDLYEGDEMFAMKGATSACPPIAVALGRPIQPLNLEQFDNFLAGPRYVVNDRQYMVAKQLHEAFPAAHGVEGFFGKSPTRSAYIAPGYVRPDITDEEIANFPITTRVVVGNERQFDLWLAVAMNGRTAPSEAVGEIVEAEIAEIKIPTAAEIAALVVAALGKEEPTEEEPAPAPKA